MIDHSVKIGSEDVSMDINKIEVQQSIETDSDPGKITITLANRAQKYTNKWPPQKTGITILLYNWVYPSAFITVNGKLEPILNYSPVDSEGKARSKATYLLATGHMTDNSADQAYATVKGECDLGHLSDSLPDQDIPLTTPKETLAEVLSKHKDFPIEFDWDPALDDRNRLKERETYNSTWTYQEFLDDICGIQVGAVYYFNEANRLQIKDPYSDTGVYNLDPYVQTPNQTKSIMSFKNAVVVVGDETKSKSANAIGVTGSTPVISQYPRGYDLDSIEEVGYLFAPVFRDYNIKTVEEANKKADELLKFYKIHKNALTEVVVIGIAPPLQSIVEYSPFVPISDEEGEKMQANLKSLLSQLQALEETNAANNKRDVRTIKISSKVRGIVVNKSVTYSAAGFKTTLNISPGLVDGIPITDDDIGGSVLNYTDEED